MICQNSLFMHSHDDQAGFTRDGVFEDPLGRVSNGDLDLDVPRYSHLQARAGGRSEGSQPPDLEGGRRRNAGIGRLPMSGPLSLCSI